MSNGLFSEWNVFVHHGQCAHDEARCAKATLQCVVFAETLLHHMQICFAVGHAFDGGDMLPLRLQSQTVA